MLREASSEWAQAPPHVFWSQRSHHGLLETSHCPFCFWATPAVARPSVHAGSIPVPSARCCRAQRPRWRLAQPCGVEYERSSVDVKACMRPAGCIDAARRPSHSAKTSTYAGSTGQPCGHEAGRADARDSPRHVRRSRAFCRPPRRRAACPRGRGILPARLFVAHVVAPVWGASHERREITSKTGAYV